PRWNRTTNAGSNNDVVTGWQPTATDTDTEPTDAKPNTSETNNSHAHGAANQSTTHSHQTTPWHSPPTTHKQSQTADTYTTKNSNQCTANATQPKARPHNPTSAQPDKGGGTPQGRANSLEIGRAHV